MTHGGSLRTISGIVALMERADIRRRTQRGRRARAAEGKLFPASFPLYGYLFADDAHTRYVPDPETEWVVRRIYTDIANGVPIRELARRLTAEGIPTSAQILAKRGQLPKGWRNPPQG